MAEPVTRQDAEHRLANLVARWVRVREEKATTVREYNDDLKKIEEAIEKLSGQLEGGGFQSALPFDEPARSAESVGRDAATIAAQAVADLAPKEGSGVTEVSLEVGGKPETRVTLTAEHGRKARALLAKGRVLPDGPDEPELPPDEEAAPPLHLDARDPGFTQPSLRVNTWSDCTCGHPREHHDGAAGCLRNGRPCRSYRERDPLGLEGWVPPAERGDTNLAEEIDGGPGEVSDEAS